MARSRVCACRGCEPHTGACGWPTTNERRCDRCGRPGFANRFRRTPDHPVRRTQRLAPAGEADGRGPRRGPRLALPGLASRAAPGATRRARGRPSGAARPRWRAAAGAARRPLRELQRAQGVEPAAAVMTSGGGEAPRASRRIPWPVSWTAAATMSTAGHRRGVGAGRRSPAPGGSTAADGSSVDADRVSEADQQLGAAVVHVELPLVAFGHRSQGLFERLARTTEVGAL